MYSWHSLSASKEYLKVTVNEMATVESCVNLI